MLMDTTKIRMKIGDHEFEAEGPAETVREQLEAFRTLLSVGTVTAKPIAAHEQPENTIVSSDPTHVTLERIMQVHGRIVSLTAIPAAEGDAGLLIMLGNKEMRNNESVTGMEIGDGMAQSGRPVGRVDRMMEKLIGEGFVLKSGFRRGVKYRLSNSGHQKALAVARELIATLP